MEVRKKVVLCSKLESDIPVSSVLCPIAKVGRHRPASGIFRDHTLAVPRICIIREGLETT